MNGLHLTLIVPPEKTDGGLSIAEIEGLINLADDSTVDRISVGDIQGNHLECYTGLGFAAARTARVAVGPYVTNPAARDPGIHAAALASLDVITSGRTFLVMGRGDGMIRNLGLTPASLRATRDAVATIRMLLRDGQADHGGRRIRMRWPESIADRVPLYLAASGPRMLDAAVDVADGLYTAAGLTRTAVEDTKDRIAQAKRRHGRAEDKFDLWWVTRFGIAETRKEAVDTVSESLSSIGNHSLRGTDFAERRVPEELWSVLREYHERYDWSKKNNPGSGRSNADLMRELGLEDYFLERFAIAGTPGEIVQRLRELDARGVDKVVLNVSTRRQLELLVDQVLPSVVEGRGT